MKKGFIFFYVLLFLFSKSIFAENVTGEKTFQPILLDGNRVEIGSYLINERNYLKLRDVAAILNGTKSQFNVSWDEKTGYVIIETGLPYFKLQSYLTSFPSGKINGVKGKINLLLNGELKEIETVLINENNYLHLRQLGEIINFGVSYDEKTSAVLISTNMSEMVSDNMSLNSIYNYIELSKQYANNAHKAINFSDSFNINSIMPYFEVDLIDESLKNIPLSKLFRDKVQIFNFFQISCPHCVSEMDDLSRANSREDLDVVLVSLDRESAPVIEYFRRQNYNMPLFKASVGEDVVNKYNLKIVPFSVFAKDGRVLGYFIGELNDSKINFIMDELNNGKIFPNENLIRDK